MSGYRGEPGFRALHVVETYWQSLRRGDEVPKRSEIDPRGIEAALEYAFILEKIAPGLARLRIAGMHLSDLMGMEVRGMPLSSFVPPSGRAGFADTIEAVTTAPAVAWMSLNAETGIGKPPLEGRLLLLPLESDFRDISRVLGCFETRGQIGRVPRRFNIVQTELQRLEVPGGATRRSEGKARPSGARPDTVGFGEPRVTFRHHRGQAAPGQDKARRPTYLRLVKSDG